MHDIKIAIEEESLAITNDSITGVIYFEVGEEIFPGLNWNDFVVTLLSWWLHALSNIVKSKKEIQCNFLFMEGPFKIMCTKIENDYMDLKFTRRRLKGEEILFQTKCSINQLIEEVLATSSRLIKLCNKRKLYSQDIKKLDDAIKLFNQI